MSTNERYPSLDRTLGAGKPVDPATRLSELLAQSLEELTRPFDPPRPAALRAAGEGASTDAPAEEPAPEQTPEESRLDADKALAELEAELFAAAKQVDRETAAPAAEVPAEPGDDGPAEHAVMADAPAADQPEAVLAAYSAKPGAAEAPNRAI